MTEKSCPFCSPDDHRVFYEGKLVFALWDGFPVAPGHALLVPKRHVATWFDATPEEREELLAATEVVRDHILSHFEPAGFNLGINIGTAAGQTVFHLHLHVIPRYHGDVEDPTGGVRNVIPAKANYLKRPVVEMDAIAKSAHRGITGPFLDLGRSEHLVSGGDDPLLPHLQTHLDVSERADMAVAFILESGIDLLEEHLQSLLDRGGRVRLLTGDYLGITDPIALSRLLDLCEGATGQFELRVFESRGVSFHPKAYIFYIDTVPGGGVAYVGSSNLSGQALAEGIEWNYRIVPAESHKGFRAVTAAFETLFCHARTRPVDHVWIRQYQESRRPPCINVPPSNQGEVILEEAQRNWGRLPVSVPAEIVPEDAKPSPEPHRIQREALEALARTRAEGNQAGLVVLATGLGKTWLAAFDSVRFGAGKVLFVAHREEILRQALKTFRRIRPFAALGLYNGTEKLPGADVLFASIQTLGRTNHLRSFDRNLFDYVVIDEFHHASARSYQKLIDHFQPAFLLGLTATPERTDGGDLLALCAENLVYRCDLVEGIRDGLLCPFRYFGVPDEVDYSNIPWRSGRFNEEALTRAVATKRRAVNALEQYRSRAGRRTLAFCCSQRHADFMADYFTNQGVRAASVHSGPQTAPRGGTLKRLTDGELDVIFAVDMFNEGVDLPNVDTVMMLRPTESRILWLQQFGRGLRVAEGKDYLRVIDYIGNHRSFLLKPRTLLGLGRGDNELSMALEAVQNGTFDLPPGCEVTYELEAVDVLRALIKMPPAHEALRFWYEDFKENNDRRPTAVEAFHEGYNPRSARKNYGSWFRFLAAMGDLSADERNVLENSRAGDFLDILETTPMSRSFKMLTLMAMLNEGQLPGQIKVERLVEGFAQLALRSATLRTDVGVDLQDRAALRRYLERNPIEAWTGGRGTKRKSFFSYRDGVFGATFTLEDAIRAAFHELAREIIDWRLAEYLQRPSLSNPVTSDILCRVSHASGRPILFLPDRKIHPRIPLGWTEVLVEGEPCEANFVKVAVNVLRRRDSAKNVLSEILRRWFGSDAGRPGTNFQVVFRESDGSLILEPIESERF
ncbi:DEAD/DEAH box helicase family protein [Syntrophobacter fumaroxidans]|uniref:Type III restriction enzyme, res subunit n=1 Tax=Syntrophobacter fumaroxidans (strain DSM 10017 / MPOB) TaxID=335543 RepID=A0LI77_SYNFM|nr:DEAD/DEAH box helicase family protein [Syntrophobacter fumaroxidans]ABK17129.1 type III restriction enzyme, res subunit [Syntrophobacter fumaroxidans MPOB]